MGGIEITEAIRRGAREMLDSREDILRRAAEGPGAGAAASPGENEATNNVN